MKPADTKNPACAGFPVIGGFQRYLLKPEDGAQKRTRTSTELPPLAPEASASTNSATWAGGRVWCSAVAILSTVRWRRSIHAAAYNRRMTKTTGKRGASRDKGPAKAGAEKGGSGKARSAPAGAGTKKKSGALPGWMPDPGLL